MTIRDNTRTATKDQLGKQLRLQVFGNSHFATSMEVESLALRFSQLGCRKQLNHNDLRRPFPLTQ